MSHIKKMLFVLIGLLVFTGFPVLAQDTQKPSLADSTVSVEADKQAETAVKTQAEADNAGEDISDAEKSEITIPQNSTESEPNQEATKETQTPTSVAEVFIDSNALNSKISIEVDEEIVSGPGNKVLAVIPAGSTFKVVTEPAEGSQTMAVEMKMRDLSGQVASITPESEESNEQIYQVPQNAEGVSGAVFFGNTAENSQEEAQNFVAQTTNESAAKRTIVDSEEKLVEASQNTAPTASENATADESTTISDSSEIPETGIEDGIDLVPVFLTAILLAGVTLWSRKKLNENSENN